VFLYSSIINAVIRQQRVMNLEGITSDNVEHLKNCGGELSLETVELLDVNALCGDEREDSW